MGRWTQYDEDEYRLPEGMRRIGYDADTQTYFFRDVDGSVWKGAEGAQYSEMTRVSDPPSSPNDADADETDLEASPRRADGYQPLSTDLEPPMADRPSVNVGAFRTLFPFFLIIGVVLLLIWRLILAPALYAPHTPCPDDTMAYWARPGDTCWTIATEHGCSLETLQRLNPQVKCEKLMPGRTICLPALAQ